MARPPGDPLACADVNDMVEPFLDGDLSMETTAAIEEHFTGCPECSSDLDLATAIASEFKNLPQFDTPEALLTKIRRHTNLDPHPKKTNTWRFRRRPAVFLAAAAAAVFAAAVVLVDFRTPPNQASSDRATAEARLAFALIADATRRAEDELMAGMVKERILGTAVKTISRSLRLSGGSGRQPQQSPSPKPTPNQGGMT